MARRYGQRDTDTYTGHGFVGTGQLVHKIENGLPICGSGRSTLAHSHHRPRITPAHHAPVTCQKCLKAENA